QFQLNELRTAVQLERRFAQAQLLTMFANRAWFGESLTGIQAASRDYFGKNPDQLDIGEAAVLAGVLRAPSILSPSKNLDRALRRRNEVIDAMATAHMVTPQEAEIAKLAPLKHHRSCKTLSNSI